MIFALFFSNKQCSSIQVNLWMEVFGADDSHYLYIYMYVLEDKDFRAGLVQLHRLNAYKQLKDIFQLNFILKNSSSHALRPLSNVNQSSKTGSIRRFTSKEHSGSELKY